jgi:hypothetical protein
MDNYIKKLLRESLSEITTTSLSPNEEKIINDILSEDLNEGFGGEIIEKLNGYAKKGMLTAGIILALLSNEAVAQEQKQEILNVAKTELPSSDVLKIQKQLHIDTGLEFDAGFVDKTFAVSDKDGEAPYELPTREELTKAIVEAGLPKRFIRNIYVNYQKNSTGDEHASFLVSVRLKEDGNFKRFKQSSPRKRVFSLIINALQDYRPSGERSRGATFNLEVIDSEGDMIGNKTLHFNS